MDLSLSRLPAAPARLPVPLAASLGVVLLLHAGVLLRSGGTQPGMAPAPALPQVHVRMVPSPAAPTQAPAATAETVAAGPEASAQAMPPAQPLVPSVAQPVAQAPELATPPLPASPDAGVPPSASEDYYRPRSELTTPPEPIVMIQVLFPASFQDKGDYSAQLSLYIDETGRVRRVRVETLGLPPDLQEAASQAFLNAYFQPGRVEGQAVKSLMRVEVAFENRPA